REEEEKPHSRARTAAVGSCSTGPERPDVVMRAPAGPGLTPQDSPADDSAGGCAGGRAGDRLARGGEQGVPDHASEREDDQHDQTRYPGDQQSVLDRRCAGFVLSTFHRGSWNDGWNGGTPV